VLVVDEPETHFHSLLAVKLWDALEDSRPDVRFVYVTHDLTFARSRRKARYVLASPTDGLKTIAVDDALPGDVAEALLGSASLSFYATRIVFCEGGDSSKDHSLYDAWFDGPDTVLRAVQGCERVLRCVEALNTAGVAHALTAIGIVDGDVHPQAFKDSISTGARFLDVHEVESLYALPALVQAVCSHLKRPFDPEAYRKQLAASVSAEQMDQLVIQRWKARVEPHLQTLVSGVSKKGVPVAELVGELPNLFDYTQWGFSPTDFLEEERVRVEAALTTEATLELLAIVPGKQLLPVAAQTAGVQNKAYVDVVVGALRDSQTHPALSSAVSAALAPHLPPRYEKLAIPTVAPL
jgi:hypothetical protein